MFPSAGVKVVKPLTVKDTGLPQSTRGVMVGRAEDMTEKAKTKMLVVCMVTDSSVSEI